MAVNKMTPEQEDRITHALSKMSELVNQGEHPTEALYKVAAEGRVPAGHVRLMAHAYNTGRTLHQVRAHETLHEKLAEFPLADAADVLERMYPSQVKTAAELHHSRAVSDDYRLPPHYWVEREKQAEKRAAASQVDLRALFAQRDGLAELPPPVTSPPDPRWATKRAFDEKRKLEREVEELRLRSVGAQYDALESLRKLAAYFRQAGALPLPAVRENVAAVHGPRGAKLMDKVAELLGPRGQRFGPVDMKTAYRQLDEHHEKRAAYEARQVSPSIFDEPPPERPPLPERRAVKEASAQHLVHWDRPPYSLVTDCFLACERAVTTRIASEAFEKEAGEKIANRLRPFVPTERNVITGSIWDAVSPTDGEKQASILGLGAAGAIGGYAKGLAEAGQDRYDKQLQKTVDKLSENDENLRAIQTRAMLHDMLQNDPVIGGYSPQEVTDAFNRISEVAPRAAQHRLIAQSLIRKYLEQASAVDPFDVDQLLGVEKKLVERDPAMKPAKPA